MIIRRSVVGKAEGAELSLAAKVGAGKEIQSHRDGGLTIFMKEIEGLKASVLERGLSRTIVSSVRLQ